MLCRFILLFLLSTSHLALGANTIAIIDDKNDSYNLAKNGMYFIDESQNLPFTTISSDQYAKQFLPINGDYLQFGLLKGVLWIRADIAIRTTNNMPTLLEINAPRIQYIDIYLPDFYQNQVQAEFGNARLYSHKNIQSPNYLFNIPTHMPPVFTIYLKLSSHLPINAHIELKTLSKVSTDAQKSLTFTGLLIGILLTLFASNFLFFIKYSHPMYLVYGGLLVSVAVLHLALHGQISQFFPNIIGVQERIYNLASLLCLCAIVFFSKLYLDTKRYLPRIDSLLTIIGGITGILAVVFTLAPEAINIKILSLTAVFTLFFLMTIAIIAFIRDVPFSGYYLIARSILLIGHSAWVLSVYGIIPNIVLLGWGLTITIIMEALVHFIGMIVQTTPFLQKYSHKSDYSQADTFDLISDLASRFRRQINVIEGTLADVENTTKSPDAQDILTHGHIATSNLKGLLERVNYLNVIKNNTPIEKTLPIYLDQLIENAYNNAQRLDQDNTFIELNTKKTHHVEILQNAKILQHLIEVFTQEFKHFSNQTLTLNITYHDTNREGLTLLEISGSPLPTRVNDNIKNFDLGINYITLLVQHLKGKIQRLDSGQNRTMRLEIPLHSHIRHSINEVDQQDHFDFVIFGQEDNDLQKALTLLHGHTNKIEHFSELDNLLDYLEHPEKRTDGSIIIVFDNGGHIPHITQQRILPLMRSEDQCLLISNNVKMSLNYAKKLGFDDILASADLEEQMTKKLSRLIQKGDRLKNTSLSRIKPLRKTS